MLLAVGLVAAALVAWRISLVARRALTDADLASGRGGVKYFSAMPAFAPEYVDLVLNDIFEDAKRLFLVQLRAIDYAHLVMLTEQGIVSGTPRA